jgi:hypothetical protein
MELRSIVFFGMLAGFAAFTAYAQDPTCTKNNNQGGQIGGRATRSCSFGTCYTYNCNERVLDNTGPCDAYNDECWHDCTIAYDDGNRYIDSCGSFPGITCLGSSTGCSCAACVVEEEEKLVRAGAMTQTEFVCLHVLLAMAGLPRL